MYVCVSVYYVLFFPDYSVRFPGIIAALRCLPALRAGQHRRGSGSVSAESR